MSATRTDLVYSNDAPDTQGYTLTQTSGMRTAKSILSAGLVAAYGTINRTLNSNCDQSSNIIFFNCSTPAPGEAIDDKIVESSRRLEAARSLVDEFQSYGFSWTGDEPFKISKATADTAKILLQDLAPRFGLPKIAPNDEEGLMMLWSTNADPVLVIVDQWQLHLVKAATTPRADYHENIPFAGEVPVVVTEALK